RNTPTRSTCLLSRSARPRATIDLTDAPSAATTKTLLVTVSTLPNGQGRTSGTFVTVLSLTMTQITPKASRGQVVAWGLWDWGSAGFNTIIVTFVFSAYLTSSVGTGLCTPDQLTADESCPAASSMLGWALGIAGFFIAILAPVTGQRADAGGRRKLSLGIFTYVTVATMLALFFVKNDSS